MDVLVKFGPPNGFELSIQVRKVAALGQRVVAEVIQGTTLLVQKTTCRLERPGASHRRFPRDNLRPFDVTLLPFVRGFFRHLGSHFFLRNFACRFPEKNRARLAGRWMRLLVCNESATAKLLRSDARMLDYPAFPDSPLRSGIRGV